MDKTVVGLLVEFHAPSGTAFGGLDRKANTTNDELVLQFGDARVLQAEQLRVSTLLVGLPVAVGVAFFKQEDTRLFRIPLLDTPAISRADGDKGRRCGAAA